MPIPNAEKAIVPPEKLSGYLLNPLHPVGGPKALWFLMLGYQAEAAEVLAVDLLKIVRSSSDFESFLDSFGVKYAVRGFLRGPRGRLVAVQSIWMIEKGEDVPKLITAYPVRNHSNADQGT